MEEEVFKKKKTLIIFNIYKYEFCMNHLKSQINSSFFVDSMKGGKKLPSYRKHEMPFLLHFVF